MKHFWCDYRDKRSPWGGNFCCACESHICEEGGQKSYTHKCAGDDTNLEDIEWTPQSVKKDIEDNFVKKNGTK